MKVNDKVKIIDKKYIRLRDIPKINEEIGIGFSVYKSENYLDEVYNIERMFLYNNEQYAIIKSNNSELLIRIKGLRTNYKVGDEVVVDLGDQRVLGTIRCIDNVEPKFNVNLNYNELNATNQSCVQYEGDNLATYWVNTASIQFKYVSSEEHNPVSEQETKSINDLKEEIKNLTKTIAQKERMQDLLNEAIIEKGKDLAVEDLKEKLKSELDTFVQEKYGVLPKVVEIKTEKSHKQMTGIFHKEFENICRIVQSDIPLMLVGGAGAGKNYTLEQVAEALDLDFYFSNAVNQEYKLTGFIDANGKYHETEFYKAFTKGGMFFLDEIDASCPECLVILNSAIANRYFDFPTGRVKAHENFRVVCAGNTFGTGADMVYVGRNVLDGATLDRFVVLQFDYDENVEKQLAYDEELYNFIYDLRKAVDDSNLRYIISMRALINASKLLQLGMDKKSILKTSIIKNMQIDDLNVITNKLNNNNEWTRELKKLCKES